MAKWTISLKNVFKLYPRSRIMDENVLIKVELILEVSFKNIWSSSIPR
jgi:hypothetical protein